MNTWKLINSIMTIKEQLTKYRLNEFEISPNLTIEELDDLHAILNKTVGQCIDYGSLSSNYDYEKWVKLTGFRRRHSFLVEEIDRKITQIMEQEEQRKEKEREERISRSKYVFLAERLEAEDNERILQEQREGEEKEREMMANVEQPPKEEY
jgi:hypothetical protein